MRFARALLLSISVALLGATPTRDASACGGCFPPPPTMQQSETTQVSGHRMILSIDKTQTTLWDQISYVGEPKSFAWVLPTKGVVTVGLSSDALFANLETLTAVTVNSPKWTCAGPPSCGATSASFSASTGTTTAGGGPVTVLGEEVVGPYETVQLSSQDPAALTDWLVGHGYVIQPDIAPIIDAYVNEGFNFLALKLVPGQAVSSMRPVRITTPGASTTLPLRMVAAGTGATTPISLWVFGEGRYAPANFPSFEIELLDIVWDWDTSSSNYTTLRQQGFAATKGKGWLVEAAEPISPFAIQDPLTYTAEVDPVGSGYADDLGMGAPEACAADLEALLGAINMTDLWVTRLYAELPRAALATDLDIAASVTQTVPVRSFTALATTGTQPKCPTYSPCDDIGGASGAGGAGGAGAGAGGAAAKDGGDSGCGVAGRTGTPEALGGFGLLLGLAVMRRRRGSIL